jgi:precorrin-2 dehydrogenase / sirohydrochlorin ferrochelatase
VFGLFLKMHGRLAVVIGGGSVGRRKMHLLRSAGATVRVTCLEARPEGVEGVEWLSQAYEARHLDGASLVFAAATREVNARVVADARARGVWVCDAVTPEHGDFVTPALVRRGDVVLAVSTGVPALTKHLRQRIEAEIGPEYATWAALLAALRVRVLADVPHERREALWEALTSDEWPARLREDEEGVAEAVEALLRSAAKG